MIWDSRDTRGSGDEVRRERQRVNYQPKRELIWERLGLSRGFEKTYKVHLVKLSHPMFLKNPSQDWVTWTKRTRRDEMVMVRDDNATQLTEGTLLCARRCWRCARFCFVFLNGSSVAAPRRSELQIKLFLKKKKYSRQVTASSPCPDTHEVKVHFL